MTCRCFLGGYEISGLHQFSVGDDTTIITREGNVVSDHAYGSNISSIVEFILDGRDFILTGSASGGVILLERTLSGDIGVIDSLGAMGAGNILAGSTQLSVTAVIAEPLADEIAGVGGASGPLGEVLITLSGAQSD